LTLVLVLAIPALLLFKGWRLYTATQELRADVRAIEALAQPAPDRQALAALGPALSKARADAASLQIEAWPLLPLTRYLGWVPGYGADLAAAQPLLDGAVDLTAALDESFQALSPLVERATTAPPAVNELAQHLTAAHPRLEMAHQSLVRAREAWSLIRTDTLSPRLRGRAERIEALLPIMQGGLELAIAAPDLIDDLAQLQSFVRSRPGKAQLATLGPLLGKLRMDVAGVRAAAEPLLPLSPRLSRVPVYGPDLASAAPLLRFAGDLSAAADLAFQAFAPVLLDRGAGVAKDLSLAERLAQARPQLEQARTALARADDDLGRIRMDALSLGLRNALQPIANALPELRDGLDFAVMLPGLLGADGRREYLLLAQNSDELRPTGGFISGAGVLAFDRGRLADFSIGDSVAVDTFFAGRPYPNPPEPLLRYMDIPLWVFRDTNWSPDFPTSARAALDLYRIGQSRELQNVVAFDPAFAQMLLAVTGPLAVEGQPAPISAENVVQELRSPTGLPGDAGREEFKRRLARALLAKFETDGAQLNMQALSRTLRRALDERHLLLYVADPAATELFAARGWDGAIDPGSADYLMVVDSNVGYNKVNANIQTAISYTLDLRDPRAPLADLTVAHANRAAGPAGCRQWGVDPAIADSRQQYDEWMNRCFYDYMRVLIPDGSQYVVAQTQPTPAEWLMSGVADNGAVTVSEGEVGADVLSTFLVVPRGATRATHLRYRLPESTLTEDARGWHYQLKLQKQAGTDAVPVTVQLQLPPGVSLVDAAPTPTTRDDDILTFSMRLDIDQAIDVRFMSK
jgi:hypothetical protein